MKNNNKIDPLPKEMADIKSGRIFEVPPGYFDQLSEQLFDKDNNFNPPAKNFSKIRSLRIWMVAASIAALISLSWWFVNDSSIITDNSITTEAELSEYIQQEIMEYDLESLSQNLNDADLYSLTEDETQPYKKYIEEHFEDFDEILY